MDSQPPQKRRIGMADDKTIHSILQTGDCGEAGCKCSVGRFEVSGAVRGISCEECGHGVEVHMIDAETMSIHKAVPKPQPQQAGQLHSFQQLHANLWGSDAALTAMTVKVELDLPDRPSPQASLDFDGQVFPPLRYSGKKVSATFLDLGRLLDIIDPRTLPCGSKKILVLDDYPKTYDLVESRNANFIGSVEEEEEESDGEYDARHLVITGNPGIGKTCFLSYSLLRRLSLGLETVVVMKGEPESFYVFGGEGVQKLTAKDLLGSHTELVRKKTVWCLCDETPPVTAYRDSNWIVVQSTSPDPSTHTSWTKYASASILVMDLWSWPEIFSLYHRDNNVSRTMRLAIGYAKYGGVPRTISRTYLTKDWAINVAVHETMVEEKAMVLLNRNPHAAMLDTGSYKNTASHQLIALRPLKPHGNSDHRRPPNRRFVKEIPTPFLEYAVAVAATRQTNVITRQFYTALCGNPLLRSSAGYAFETLVHRVIKDGRVAVTITAVLTDNSCNSRIRLSTLPLTITVKGTHTFRKANELSDLLRATPGSTKVKAEMIDIYLQPLSPTQESVDSLIITSFRSQHRVILLQMTIAETHPIKANGLEEIYNALPHDARKHGFIIIFAIPAENTNKFTKQRIIGTPVQIARWGDSNALIQVAWRIDESCFWEHA